MARFTSGFTATSTASDVLEGVDLRGKSAVVTGASSGIEVETARALAGAGAHVVLAVRDVPAGRRAADDIARTHPAASTEVHPLDLADLASVRRFTDGWSGPLHLLINNAGIMMTLELRTPQGWELQFATNHLGHFALALGLHAGLRESGDARIVSVSSSGHGMSDIVYQDLFFERRAYDPGRAYGQSKTANVLFAVEASRRWAAEGIIANAVMPGGIWTNLQRHWDPQALADTKAYVAGAGIAMKTPAQGAATSVLAATSPLLNGVGGLYLEDCQEAETVGEIIDGTHGVRAYALDPENARRLWTTSTDLLRIS